MLFTKFLKGKHICSILIFACWHPVFSEQLTSSIQTQQENSIAFLENKGQLTDMNGSPVPDVLFKTASNGVDVYVTTKGLTYSFIKYKKENKKEETDKECSSYSKRKLQKKSEGGKRRSFEWCRLDMDLAGANIESKNIITEQPTSGEFNYYMAHCPKGIFGVREFKKITIKKIYPGIDWVLYINDNGLKYDFILHPGADIAHIQLLYRGAKEIIRQETETGASIVIGTELGKVQEGALICYERETKRKIQSNFIIQKQVIKAGENEINEYAITFKLEKYKPNESIIIDPPLAWASYYGGTGNDGPQKIHVNQNSGDIYMAGYSMSANFPVQNPGNGAYFYSGTGSGAPLAFILKFSAGRIRQWSTFYESAEITGITTDVAGNVYMAGGAGMGFPALNPGAGSFFQLPTSNGSAMISKFNSSGVCLWATCFGDGIKAAGIAMDRSGNIYIAGDIIDPSLVGSSFPTINPGGSSYFQNAYSGIWQNIFIAKFSPSCSLLWATYYGSAEEYVTDIESDCSGNLYITGTTVAGAFGTPSLPVVNPGNGAYFKASIGNTIGTFILKFDPSCALVWATYFGSGTMVSDAHLDILGNFYITGGAGGILPIQNLPGAFNQSTGNTGGFVTKFSKTGILLWSTYYDGAARNITTDRAGNLYTSGNGSAGLATPNPGGGAFVQTTWGGIFISQFNPSGALVWATYYGGQGNGWVNSIATSYSGNLYLTGEWTTQTNNAPYYTLNPGNGAYYQSNNANPNSSMASGDTDDGFILEFTGSIQLPPNSISAAPFCYKDTTMFSLFDTAGIVSLLWNFGNPASGNSDTSTAISPSHAFTSPGTYTVTVIIDYLCTTDTSKRILSILTPTANAGPDTSLCAGTGTQLNGSGGITYLWSPANGLSNANISNPSASPTANTTYVLIVTDIHGCSNTDTMNVTINPLPIANAGTDDTICSSTIMQLSATGGISFSWSPASTLSNSSISNPVASPMLSTVYTVTVTDNNGCSNTDSTSITVILSPTANAGPPNNICDGTAAQLNGSGTGAYSWSPAASLSNAVINNPLANPTVTTTYTLIVTAANGCTDTDTTSIYVFPVPNANAGPDISICQGAQVTLMATGGSAPGGYSWSPSQSLSSVNIPNPIASPVTTTTYVVTVSNGVCTDNDSVVVTVNTLPQVSFSASDTAGCPILCVNFSNTTPNAANCIWTFGNGNTSASFNTTGCYNNSGSFNVSLTVTDNNGCTNTLTKNNFITIYPVPSADFSANPITVSLLDPTVYFTDHSSGADSWQWSFGDMNGSSSTLQNPHFTYPDSGHYSTQLIVTNIYGCTDSVTKIIWVMEDFFIYVPNTFTPNGDGKNEGFIPKVMGINPNHFEMWIFDRWGNLIYKTSDLNKPWDGKANGGTEIAQIDTYVWKIHVQSIYGKKLQRIGHVNLLK